MQKCKTPIVTSREVGQKSDLRSINHGIGIDKFVRLGQIFKLLIYY